MYIALHYTATLGIVQISEISAVANGITACLVPLYFIDCFLPSFASRLIIARSKYGAAAPHPTPCIRHSATMVLITTFKK